MKKSILSLFLGLLVTATYAQTNNSNGVLDSPWLKEHTPTRKPIPYINLREADILYSKRIWRVIDLREKNNLPLYYPLEPINNRKSLWQALYDALTVEESIVAFKATIGLKMDDEFKEKMEPNEVKAKMSVVETIPQYDEDGFEIDPITDTTELSGNSIVQWKIKEDWFMDRNRSVMDVRIIGIAPMKATIDPVDKVTVLGYQEIFWLYFPWIRPVLAHQEVYNRMNDAERRTMDDWFHKRMFNSYIVKQSNMYQDRAIEDYKQGLDALVEAEEIKDKLFKMEHDMWHF